jgi:hypothetical protein
VVWIDGATVADVANVDSVVDDPVTWKNRLIFLNLSRLMALWRVLWLGERLVVF